MAKPQVPRAITFRYIGALLAVALLLVIGQITIQVALDHQQGDARIVNIAGRQRMLSQRLCVLLLAPPDPARLAELAAVADEWEHSQRALRQGDNSDTVRALFAQIDGDHRAMLAAARGAIGDGGTGSHAAEALGHADAFLSGMDRIVASYEAEAHDRVVGLRRVELALLALVLVVLALEGVFVFRPAVRGLRAYLAERDDAQRALVSVGDREQERLAQDLHDGLSQHLVGVSFLVKSLAQREPHDERLDEIGALLAESIQQTRSLARSLHSHVLETEGLDVALRELAAHTERMFDVACTVDAEPIELPVTLRGHLYRIVREAVVNAAKHAKASTIAIEVQREPRRVTLIVRDDGAGMPAGRGDGLGLHLMETRAKMIGASLAI
ncbi:MAG TPA: type IV pili methyl-accepting chemotaxis transducer N-terminal domain-containing protein, partial [Kofleriaceae bacterium]|nr:type IV pili methyl-accepting chemotaxis transducer N-terminal domain-containing protein [Kofleriaceae bacterium]